MKINFLLEFISASILLLLIINIRNSTFTRFDQKLHQKLLHDHDNFLWQIIAFVNDPKLVVIWDIFLAVFLLNENRSIEALWVIVTLGLSDFTGLLLKKWLHRTRPLEHSSLENGYSFPSGHVLGATTMILILLRLFAPGRGIIFIITMIGIWLLVVISRLILKAHYPSDILGAACLAVLCFTLSEQMFSLIF